MNKLIEIEKKNTKTLKMPIVEENLVNFRTSLKRSNAKGMKKGTYSEPLYEILASFLHLLRGLLTLKGVTHRRKSALKKALSWIILCHKNYEYFSLNGPAKSFSSADLSLCE